MANFDHQISLHMLSPTENKRNFRGCFDPFQDSTRDVILPQASDKKCFSSGVPIPVHLHSPIQYVTPFDGANFKTWRNQVEFYLGVLDLDISIYEDKPNALTNESTKEEKIFHDAWERSNRLSLKFLKMSVAENILTYLPEIKTAKEFMRYVEDISQTANKSLVATLWSNLNSKRLKGLGGMDKHVTEMANLSARLSLLGTPIAEDVLVKLILNSLPNEYGLFQMNYNIKGGEWNLIELKAKLIQEETRLMNQGRTLGLRKRRKTKS